MPTRKVWVTSSWTSMGGGTSTVTARFQPMETQDDANQVVTYVSGYVWNSETTTSIISNASAGTARCAAYRFRNIPITNGATITSAYLKLYCSGNSVQDDLYATITGEDADSPANFFTTTTLDTTTRPRTTASVEWTDTGGTLTTITSPDISSVVQEIVDRAGWAQHNPLVIFVEGKTSGGSYGTFIAEAYSNSSSNEPMLEVTWEVA